MMSNCFCRKQRWRGILVVEFCAFLLITFFILVLFIPLYKREIISSKALIVLAAFTSNSRVPLEVEQKLILKIFGAQSNKVQHLRRSFRDTPASHFYDFEEVSVSFPSVGVKERIIQENE